MTADPDDRRSRIGAIASGLVLALSLVAGLAAPTHSETLQLVPAWKPGDSYRLSLSTTTETWASSGQSPAEPAVEGNEVQLRYEAVVEVLEVGSSGHPTRERHDDVRLSFVRGTQQGSLFQEGSSLELRRTPRGDQIFADDQRLEHEVEEIVLQVLAGRIEHTRLPALLDPGRSVEVGEKWELSSSAARRLLRERGVRAIELDGPALARLEQLRDGRLAVAYEIPVAWLELTEMPHDTRPSSSRGRLIGSVRLGHDPSRGAIAHAAHLQVDLAGVVDKAGLVRPFPIKLMHSVSLGQRIARLDETGPDVAFPASPAP